MGNEQGTTSAKDEISEDVSVEHAGTNRKETRRAKQLESKNKLPGNKVRVGDMLGKLTPEEQQEENELVEFVVQQGSEQILLTLQAFLTNRGLKGHRVLEKLLDTLSQQAEEFRSSGSHLGPENDFARLGAGQVFTRIMLLIARPDSPIAESMLTSDPIIDLVSSCMRAISSTSKVPGQAAYMANDGIISCISKILQLYSNLPVAKSERVVWWTMNALFFLLSYGQQMAVLLAMRDMVLTSSLQIFGKPPWSSNERLAVHVSMVSSKIAAGFHSESLALRKGLLT